jgi:cell division protease FtsH
MVGADLANLVNEAALLAARLGRTEVASQDFAQSLEKIILGAERKIMLTPAPTRCARSRSCREARRSG